MLLTITVLWQMVPRQKVVHAGSQATVNLDSVAAVSIPQRRDATRSIASAIKIGLVLEGGFATTEELPPTEQMAAERGAK